MKSLAEEGSPHLVNIHILSGMWLAGMGVHTAGDQLKELHMRPCSHVASTLTPDERGSHERHTIQLES